MAELIAPKMESIGQKDHAFKHFERTSMPMTYWRIE
jgi:hypothetical protein